MTPAELVNLIVRKFGGNRVVFERISRDDMGHERVQFKLGHHSYHVPHAGSSRLYVWQIAEDNSMIRNSYSSWVEGVLNGLVRDEEGNMVKP